MNRYQKAVNGWLVSQALSHNISILQASFDLPNHVNDIMQQLTVDQQDELLAKSLDDVSQIRLLISKRKTTNE